MKKVIVLILLAIIGYYLVDVFSQIKFGENRFQGQNVRDFYLDKSKNDLQVSNSVTAIVVNFRGFDTLGEVTVLFLAATALGSILYRRKEHGEAVLFSASKIVRAGAHLLFAPILLLGAYVFIHGHLSPGGGFQGGTIIATGFLLMLLAYHDYKVSHGVLTWVESLAGITFATAGLAGLILGKTFLENFLPVGTINYLFSGGIIPIIYIAVGFKVGAELTGVLYTMLNEKEYKKS